MEAMVDVYISFSVARPDVDTVGVAGRSGDGDTRFVFSSLRLHNRLRSSGRQGRATERDESIMGLDKHTGNDG